jgi:cytochrome b involved in lipid metabolism
MATQWKEFTMEDVEKHCTADDMWIVINGRVYVA